MNNQPISIFAAISTRSWKQIALATAALGAIGAAKLVQSPDLLAARKQVAGDQAWPTGGGDFTEQHFSPLNQFTPSNVTRLGLAWSRDLPDEHSLEATPIEVDGVLYFSGQAAKVYAVDARNGKLLWTYDPEGWKVSASRLRLLFTSNRGVAYGQGHIFAGTFDGRLVSLDAKTGKPAWTVRTLDLGSKKYSAGAPRVFGNKVVIGNGGADFGERGYLTAYDARSGRRLWRFYAVPGSPEQNRGDAAMERAAKTWSGEYWKTGTGGTMWDGFTFDERLNRIYVGTGNSGPYNPAVRSPGNGDNLYLASIVAIDADTGKYLWHYQMNPREAWDYKATANIIMADLEVEGEKRPVIMQIPTNGFYYVIDRRDGKLLSAEKVGKVTWAERIDLKTGRPIEAPGIRYESGTATIWPGPWGAHNWQPMAYSPLTRLAYIPFMQVGAKWSVAPGAALGGTIFEPVLADASDGKGALVAWDPVAKRARWTAGRRTMWNGGVLATAGGLVFQGTEEGRLEAFEASSGRQIWSFDAKLGIIGAPISYSVGGRQYVSVLVGYGGASALQSTFNKSGWKYEAQPRRLLTFALDATAKLPTTAPRDFSVAAIDDPKLTIDERLAARGAVVYSSNGCSLCHGDKLISTGAPAPDLRESGAALDREGLVQLLHSGALASNGMPQFDDLPEADIAALHMYIRARAREALGHRDERPYQTGATRN